jgi:hypothetical protein
MEAVTMSATAVKIYMETHLINSSIWVTPAPPELPRAYSHGRPIICNEQVKPSDGNAF